MVSGSWDVTSPLIEIVGPMCAVPFMEAPWTRIPLAKAIPGTLFESIGAD
jgi:hypothetical protein